MRKVAPTKIMNDLANAIKATIGSIFRTNRPTTNFTSSFLLRNTLLYFMTPYSYS